MISPERFVPWSLVGLLGLVQCTYVNGKGGGTDEESNGLGGAGNDAESSGGSASNESGGSAQDGSGGETDPGGSNSGGSDDSGGSNNSGGSDADTGGVDNAGGTENSGGTLSTGGTDSSGGSDNSGGANAGTGGAAPVVPSTLLLMTKTSGFRNGEAIDAGKELVAALSLEEGIELTLSEASTDFTADNLAQFGAIMFLNTVGDILNTNEQDAFEAFINEGGNFIGVYSAIETEPSWTFYGDLLATRSTNHSSVVQATMDVDDATHPATAGLAAQWTRTDMWYNFSSNPRLVEGVHVLLTLDENSYAGGNMFDHPIAWTRTVGDSRIFYTGLGEYAPGYADELFVNHLRGAILWALHQQ